MLLTEIIFEPINLTLVGFILIIFLSFVALLFCGDNQEKTYQKIIGGLAVFIVAIISQNPWVFSVSMFIGGLIIASENFLKSLAAILKTDSKDVPGTLAALGENANLSYASSEEIVEEKNKEESLDNDNKLNHSHQTINENERIGPNQIQSIEEKVIKILSDKYRPCFTANLKLENKYGQIIVDGVVHRSADVGQLNIDNVLTLVEIKYIHKLSDFMFEVTARRVLEKIRYLFISKQVLIVFCVKGLISSRAEKLNSRLSSIFSKDSEGDDVVFGFFNITEALEPEEVMLGNLKPNVN